MGKVIKYSFKSKCPYLNKSHTIFIDYHEVHMCGSTNPGYKKGNYSCDVTNCPYPSKDAYGRCPVYLNSPSQPR